MNPDTSQQNLIERMSSFIHLEKAARDAEDMDQLYYIILNDARKIVSYHQAVLWLFDITGAPDVKSASGVVKLDKEGPYFLWLNQFIAWMLEEPKSNELKSLDVMAVLDSFEESWTEWGMGQCLWAPFLDGQGKIIGAVIFTRKEPWVDQEKTVLSLLFSSFSQTILFKTRMHKRKFDLSFVRRARFYVLLAAFAAAVLMFPVTLSILAPVEVVGENTFSVNSPVDGIITKFHIQPNDQIHTGDLLFELDDTVLRNRYEGAIKALAVAEADYLRTLHRSFIDPKARTEIISLKSRVEEKRGEITYTKDMLEKTKVRAERDGIALFKDVDDWLGKPVTAGERIIILADQNHVELKIWVPVADIIEFDPTQPITAFFNADPLKARVAKFRYATYDAYQPPAGVLSYKIMASFEAGHTASIGWRGTAKLYGPKVTLFYFLLRRPITYARQLVGM